MSRMSPLVFRDYFDPPSPKIGLFPVNIFTLTALHSGKSARCRRPRLKAYDTELLGVKFTCSVSFTGCGSELDDFTIFGATYIIAHLAIRMQFFKTFINRGG